MIPTNNLYLIIKNHCEYKLDIYRKMLDDIIRRQEKHVSFDNLININNNNSTNVNFSTLSTNLQYQDKNHWNENFRKKKILLNQCQQSDVRRMYVCPTHVTKKTKNFWF